MSNTKAYIGRIVVFCIILLLAITVPTKIVNALSDSFKQGQVAGEVFFYFILSVGILYYTDRDGWYKKLREYI